MTEVNPKLNQYRFFAEFAFEAEEPRRRFFVAQRITSPKDSE
jgi:hypothetical protein